MTVGKLLEMFGFAADSLADLLRALALKVPEMAATAEALIAKLNEPLTAENMADLLAVLPRELISVLKGQVDPKPHPSDGA